jgi:hypothetical protein
MMEKLKEKRNMKLTRSSRKASTRLMAPFIRSMIISRDHYIPQLVGSTIAVLSESGLPCRIFNHNERLASRARRYPAIPLSGA